MKRSGLIQKIILAVSAFLCVAVRTAYVLYTPTWVRQHDVIGFGNKYGQAAYIEYFYKYWRMPDFDPRTVWGFFQPPLHFFASALWIKAGTVLGIAYGTACENVQFLTLIYSLLLTFFAYRIFKELGIEGMQLAASTALVSLHPSYILMAGSINNDMLCILLSVMALFCFLRWSKSGSYADLISLAICVGCSMMTKLSGVLIAPALLAVFIYRWIKGGKKEFAGLLKKYLVFAAVSIPLGIWSPVRNFVEFGVPFTFTPSVGEPLATTDLFSRLFDIRTSTPFSCMTTNGDAYNEYNIPLALMKTSLTGEWDLTAYTTHQTVMTLAAWILLISGSVLAVISFVLMIRVIVFDKKRISGEVRLFSAVYYLTSVLFFLKLCISIPNFSSQDFRYIAYLIVLEAAFLGLGLKDMGRYFRYAVYILILIFCAASTGVYLLMGIAPV